MPVLRRRPSFVVNDQPSLRVLAQDVVTQPILAGIKDAVAGALLRVDSP